MAGPAPAGDATGGEFDGDLFQRGRVCGTRGRHLSNIQRLQQSNIGQGGCHGRRLPVLFGKLMKSKLLLPILAAAVAAFAQTDSWESTVAAAYRAYESGRFREAEN